MTDPEAATGPGGAPRILLVSAEMDRHARSLKAAFGAAGAEALVLDLADIAFDTASPTGLVVPQWPPGTLPDAVCVRTMDAGSFEQITRRLGLLHAFTSLGVPVSNPGTAIEACVDKAMTSFRLARAGLPGPASVAVETRRQAEAALDRAGGPMVLKPLFGAQGKGLRLVREASDLPEAADIAGGVYYLQRFVGVARAGRYSDMRVLVSRGRAVAAMRREAPRWITNIKQGGHPLAMVREPEAERLALEAAAAVGADFCGVDILREAGDALQVIEVNSMPAWTGLASATGLDIAAIRARDVLALIAEERNGRLAVAG